jgi:hypothetical protein
VSCIITPWTACQLSLADGLPESCFSRGPQICAVARKVLLLDCISTLVREYHGHQPPGEFPQIDFAMRLTTSETCQIPILQLVYDALYSEERMGCRRQIAAADSPDPWRLGR